MAFDWKTSAIAATLGGTVLISTLTFTGTINLNDIRSKGFSWADKVGQAVNETKEMATKFGLFKQDVTEQLNSKIAHINDLNARIAELGNQVTNGQGDLSAANDSIAKLSEELEKANAEVEALKNEFGLKDAEVQTAFASMETAENMNTTLSLDQQNADTVIPEDTTTTETTPTEPTTPTTSTADTIKADLIEANPMLANDLVVEITATTVTLKSTSISSQGYDVYEPIIESDLGQAVTIQSTSGDYVYVINN